MTNEYMNYLAEIIPEKDSLKLVKSEAEKYYQSHAPGDCFDMGMALYQSDNFQIQEVGIDFEGIGFMGFVIKRNQKGV